jgi:hypothetical protein
MSESAATASEDADALVAQLEAAAEAHEAAVARVEDAGEQRLQRLAEYHGELTGLMDRYEEQATSDGEGDVDMEAFIEYQEELAHFVETIPEELDHRDAFEAVDEIMHKKWLKESDFEEARETLRPVTDLVERLDERERTREDLADARYAVETRLTELDERIADLERLVELGEADIDAPVERLREPIEAYNDAVTEAFAAFKREASAREVLAFVAATDAFPLVEYRQPPADLREYVRDDPAGTETVSTLLEYADYSKSKLDHYVDSATDLKRNVATHQTYLRRLDGGPLAVEWPPPAAEALRFRCKELVPVVDRLDPEVLPSLRDVRALTRREDYDRLRDSAVAQEQLTDAERERLREGSVQSELEGLRAERDRLRDALSEN